MILQLAAAIFLPLAPALRFVRVHVQPANAMREDMP